MYVCTVCMYGDIRYKIHSIQKFLTTESVHDITSVDRVRLAIAASDSNCTMTSMSMYHSNNVFVPPAEWIFIRASYAHTYIDTYIRTQITIYKVTCDSSTDWNLNIHTYIHKHVRMYINNVNIPHPRELG